MNACLIFAELLDYPAQDLSVRVNDCASELATVAPHVDEMLAAFARAQAELGLGRLQEIYASAFDMQPECTLNLSYHLFGEDQRRGMFLAKLSGFYREAGLDVGNELPDHLCCLLRYLSTEPGAAVAGDLVSDCLQPAVMKIAHGIDASSNPYRFLLDALLLWLEGTQTGRPESGVARSVGPDALVRQV